MKIEVIKGKIIKRWEEHSPETKSELDILNFYKYLQREWGSLLEFEWKGDKYQAVRTWIEQYNLDNNLNGKTY